ncbi:MerR family transcriptional regulator [Paenibacillus dokdonensis]|uniref:MerR family transcriptional regulator n=1 Tax=Paenibacillus dokdonensis TaxID=2567944 RepID=A0ABU6GQS7_9BACL|nr:MerR family transcriptional regulator [Paenibacillus dokdonensis]MEC0240641.1 MerR family transcriptional regulator [Paenibacillus dokdonensis]
MEQYIKIKELSELTGVSVRTLQYYDEINLLTPAYINEYGHRFYDSNSFSKIFVIISLKNMGMSLNNINQYINDNDFDIRLFIKEEKRRIETAITDLQLRLMRLSILDEQVSEKQDITPYILPFFSQVTNDTEISKLQIENLAQKKDTNFIFNIKGWNEFIKDLNFCLKHKLSSKDKKTIKCIQYWKENILEANQVSGDTIKFAEEFYQKNPTNTFGITEDNYKYLVGLINEYDKN